MPGPETTPQNEQRQFVNAVAGQTGLDPRVVQVWVNAEGAYAPNGTGGHNWLNLRPASGDVGVSSVSSGNFDQFSTVDDAIASTVARLHNPFAAIILATAGRPPATQMTAIASSGWDSGHYISKGRLGGKLFDGWSSLYPNANPGGAPVTSAPGGIDTGKTTASQALASDASHIPGVAQVQSVGDFLGRVTDPAYILRGLQIVAGAVLVLVGVVLLTRQVALANDLPDPLGLAGKAGGVAPGGSEAETTTVHRIGIRQTKSGNIATQELGSYER